MKALHKLKTYLLVLALCGLPLGRPAADIFQTDATLQKLSDKQVEQLQKKSLVLYQEERENGKTAVYAIMLMDIPVETAWNFLTVPQNHLKYLKTLQRIDDVWLTADESCVHVFLKWLFVKLQFQQINHFDPAGRFYSWELDPLFANEIDEYSGFWQLYPYAEGKTLGIYLGNMSLNVLPQWLENLVKKELVKSSVRALKKYLDSLNTKTQG